MVLAYPFDSYTHIRGAHIHNNKGGNMDKKTKLALINAAIAGALVLAGAFSNGSISWQGFIASLSAALIIFLTKMRDYLVNIQDKKAMKGGIFEFI